MAKYDWDKLKAKYVAGNYKSVQEFAEKEGLTYNGSLRSRVASWRNEKQAKSRQKADKIINKTIEKVAERESDRNARHIALLDKILDKAELVIDNELNVFVDMFGKAHKGEVLDGNKLESMVRVLERAQKGHRLALGLDSKDKQPENPSVKPYVDALKGTVSEVWNDEK